MSTLEILEALAAGRMPAERAARELDRAKQQAERQAVREARERVARIKRARQAEAGREEIAAFAAGFLAAEGPRPVYDVPRVLYDRQDVLTAVADGMTVADAVVELEYMDSWASQVPLTPVGHKLGRPRTEWVKDDEHRYYKPYTRDELLAQAEQLGILSLVSQA